jgi:hypothetical protein
MLRLAAVVAFLALCAPAAAKPGAFDRSFANRGRIAFAVGEGYSGAGAMLRRPDGSLLLAGETRWVFGLARLSSAGRLLARTALPAADDESSRAFLVPLPDGTTVLIGASQRGIVVYRLDAGGEPLGDPRTISTPAAFYAVAAGGDAHGRVAVLGTSYGDDWDHTGDDDAVLVRASGATVVARGERAGAMLVRPDGAIVTATYRPGAPGRSGRVRSAGDGLHATLTLHSRARDHTAGPTALLAGPHGTLLVAGDDARGTYDNDGWPWLAWLTRHGRVYRRVKPLGTRGVDYRVNAIARDHHGRIVVAGTRGEFEFGDPQAMVTRLSAGGRLDRRFGVVVKQLGAQRGVRLIGSEVRSVAVDGRDRILLAGSAYDDQTEIREDLGRSYFAVARLLGS